MPGKEVKARTFSKEIGSIKIQKVAVWVDYTPIILGGLQHSLTVSQRPLPFIEVKSNIHSSSPIVPTVAVSKQIVTTKVFSTYVETILSP